MFYCTACARDLHWPEFGFSLGACEMCGNKAVCSDIPSRLLPIPTDEQHALVAARRVPSPDYDIEEEP